MKTEFVLLLSALVLATAQDDTDVVNIFDLGVPDTCLPGLHRKPVPSPESEDFLECQSWKNLACCKVNVSNSIHHNRGVGIYNYHWDRCAPLSPRCEQYLKNELCFYECEPMLAHFQRPDRPTDPRDVPICKTYCEQWFEACKNDMTCVEDWIDGWHYEDTRVNHCPQNSTCVTFAEMYGDAKGLCNKMWGSAFIYEASDVNCMVMKFDPETNPNVGGKPYSEASRISGLMVLNVFTFLTSFVVRSL